MSEGQKGLMKLQGNIVDIPNKRIFKGEITVENDKIIAIDKFNSHLSAGLAGAFQTYKYLPDNQKNLLRIQLNRILEEKGISSGLYEIVSKTINAGA